MPDLMCLFWTTAGIFPLEAETSPYSFKDRVEAAARAGFKGIGLWHSDLELTMQRHGLPEMKRILDDNGMRHLELEFLTDWFVDGEKKRASDRRKKLLLEASAALHAHHVKMGDFDNTPYEFPRVVEAFAALCADAAAFGATIGFELMPSSMIHSLPEAISLVEEAGAANGGLILDIAHVGTLGISCHDIQRIPRGKLICVELNDGTVPGSPRHDPSRARRFCGEGDFDIKGFIQCVRSTGYDGPWALEVFSKELTTLPLEQLSERAFATTISQFKD